MFVERDARVLTKQQWGHTIDTDPFVECFQFTTERCSMKASNAYGIENTIGEKKVDIASIIHSRYLDLLLDDKQKREIVSPNVAIRYCVHS